MTDYIIGATAASGAVRAYAAITTDLVQNARVLHNLSPVASAALGRTLTAAVLMARIALKGLNNTITIQIKGDGPLGGIVVVSDANSRVRGYVYNPDAYMPLNQYGKLDVGGAVGRNGYMNVIKDLNLKEPYIGYVDLVSGEIGEDIAFYYASSEQVPTAVSLGVLINTDESILASGGFIIQLLPGASEELAGFIEEKVNNMPSVTTMISQGQTPEEMLSYLLGEKGLGQVERYTCSYECNCSRERMEKNLISLGRKELQEIVDERGEAELQCHFCNAKYMFDKNELTGLLEDSALQQQDSDSKNC